MGLVYQKIGGNVDDSLFYILVFYVPETEAEKVKNAVFAAGAGRLGNYDSCCWQTTGTGQFRPLAGSQPFVGSQNKIEKVTETRVELMCRETVMEGVLAALQQAHPYETPAFAFWPVKGMQGEWIKGRIWFPLKYWS